MTSSSAGVTGLALEKSCSYAGSSCIDCTLLSAGFHLQTDCRRSREAVIGSSERARFLSEMWGNFDRERLSLDSLNFGCHIF